MLPDVRTNVLQPQFNYFPSVASLSLLKRFLTAEGIKSNWEQLDVNTILPYSTGRKEFQTLVPLPLEEEEEGKKMNV